MKRTKVIRDTVILLLCEQCGDEVEACAACGRQLQEGWTLYCQRVDVKGYAYYKHYCPACKGKTKKEK